MRPRAIRPGRPRHPRAVTAASDDGAIAFKLVACRGGVLVERSQILPGSGRVVQSMLFHDDAAFTRWCEADRLQFTYPLLYANLRRSGHALFDAAA